MKRFADCTIALIGLIVFSPMLIIVAILIKMDSRGPVFYRQVRVARYNNDFKIFKFRTMFIDADKKGLLTIGGRDSRVTKIGYYLRKSKLDELSQLINVVLGDMSFVGPRPEVRSYVSLYTEEQMEVLNVRPGITDLASIEFRNESDLLREQDDPNKFYIEVIMQKKLSINLKYLKKRNLLKDFVVVLKTFQVIVKN
ncbi:glycosyltransferase [Polaribacter irgensii 23-P]|uniref:Glycosyltransferase n=1 Tax=Polaribacter irgensii 23-P TaxID=313594 RepID=A4BYN2_9FLAO|nr:sugar transferase [Polaribacter irgensii]EAR12275.1 glycosyltransferase [Polaribacter irgensii 23-P]